MAPPGPHDTPSSRSSSSIGLPGSYGAIFAIAASTSSSLSLLTGAPCRCTVRKTIDPLALRAARSRSLADARSRRFLRRAGAWIRAEHFDELAARLERAQRRFHPRLPGVPVDVDEEDVVPQLLPRRPRLDARQVEPRVRERLQHLVEHAGRVLERKQDRRLVAPRRRRRLPPHDEEARHVAHLVLD